MNGKNHAGGHGEGAPPACDFGDSVVSFVSASAQRYAHATCELVGRKSGIREGESPARGSTEEVSALQRGLGYTKIQKVASLPRLVITLV